MQIHAWRSIQLISSRIQLISSLIPLLTPFQAGSLHQRKTDNALTLCDPTPRKNQVTTNHTPTHTFFGKRHIKNCSQKMIKSRIIMLVKVLINWWSPLLPPSSFSSINFNVKFFLSFVWAIKRLWKKNKTLHKTRK